jgi:hypothetical protein
VTKPLVGNHFDTLILIARPAAGKSEIIHFLKRVPENVRLHQYHIGQIDEIDDFPMLWTWFEEDDLLTQMGYSRLHTEEDGSFRWNYLWNLLIRRISLEYMKKKRDSRPDAGSVTALIEFARGKEHGGFREAFQHLSKEILKNASVLYIDVSFAESLRKNRKRYNPNKPDSILEHGLTDENLGRLYSEIDWGELSKGEPGGYLIVQGIQVPFIVFDNEDDVTTQGGDALGNRLNKALEDLWHLSQKRP